jgi:hypothetical protein
MKFPVEELWPVEVREILLRHGEPFQRRETSILVRIGTV